MKRFRDTSFPTSRFSPMSRSVLRLSQKFSASPNFDFTRLNDRRLNGKCGRLGDTFDRSTIIFQSHRFLATRDIENFKSVAATAKRSLALAALHVIRASFNAFVTVKVISCVCVARKPEAICVRSFASRRAEELWIYHLQRYYL